MTTSGAGAFTTGVAVGTKDHSIFMALRWTGIFFGSRQWILRLGHGGGAEHWLWNGGDSVQVGEWGGGVVGQIKSAPMTDIDSTKTTVLATVVKGGVYKMYIDGVLVAGQAATTLTISDDAQLVVWPNYNAPIHETNLYMETFPAEEVMRMSRALQAKYPVAP